YPIVASFAGDINYVSSGDTTTFVITREETTTVYTGPTVILEGGSGVTLRGELLEDGTTPISGRPLTLRLGAEGCARTTDGSGVASCSLVFKGPLGAQPLEASFDGDAFYLPSADASKTATVFAFPAGGAFVLGDDTVGSALPGSALTWWSAEWASDNSVSGG